MFDFITEIFSVPMRLFYSWTGNYAIALLLFAVLVKIVLLPFSIKQQKNFQKQASLAPQEAALRKKYKGRNDQPTQQKMQQELMDLYQKEGYNPMGGCLPMLVQLPIIMLLYSVVTKPLRWLCDISTETVSAVFFRIKELFLSGALGAENLPQSLYNKLSSAKDLAALGEAGVSQIDMISAIKAVPEQFADLISVDVLPNFNAFGTFGDLSQTPSFSPFNWMVIIPVLIFAAQFFGTKLQRKFSYQPAAAQQNAGSMKVMEWTMPLLSVWISFGLPAVVGLYWVYQNAVGVLQQFILSKLMPLPTFTEEQYKAAERALNSNIKSAKKKVRSLHRIDEGDELPPRSLPEKEEKEQEAKPEAPAPLKEDDRRK